MDIVNCFPGGLPQTTGSYCLFSPFTICFTIFSPCVIDPTDFLGAAVICHVIVHYRVVLILRALKYFYNGTKAMAAPAIFILNCGLNQPSHALGCCCHPPPGSRPFLCSCCEGLAVFQLISHPSVIWAGLRRL